MVLGAILASLRTLEDERFEMSNGNGGDELREKLVDKVGELVGTKVIEMDRSWLARAVLEGQV